MSIPFSFDCFKRMDAFRIPNTSCNLNIRINEFVATQNEIVLTHWWLVFGLYRRGSCSPDWCSASHPLRCVWKQSWPCTSL